MTEDETKRMEKMSFFQAEQLVQLYREGFESVDPFRKTMTHSGVKQVHEKLNTITISSIKSLIIIYEHYPLKDNIAQHLLAACKHKLSIKEKMTELASILQHAADIADKEHKQKVSNKPSLLKRIIRR